MIFVVSEDTAVRNALAILLEAGGFRVRLFASIAAFLKEGLPGSILTAMTARRCLLVEHCQPGGGTDGIGLAKRLAAAGTMLPVVVLTDAIRGSRPPHTAAENAPFFADPFRPDAVLRAVADALRSPRWQRTAGMAP